MVFLSKTKLKEEECKKKKILSFQHKDFYPNKTKTFFFFLFIFHFLPLHWQFQEVC